jgi:hypothetical protein
LIDEIYSFTLPAYIKLLEQLQEHYKLIRLEDAPLCNPPYLILRHDVDFSLESSLRMAVIEGELGFTATYCVLFSSKHYNLMERSALASIRHISELGHEVALHYDLKAYREYGLCLRKSLVRELSLLGELLGKPVRSMIMHQVGMESGDPFKQFPDIVNGFDKELYDLYVTDSYRAWYRSYLEKLFSFKYDKVQLVIHSGQWTEKPMGRLELLQMVDEMDLVEPWRGNPKIEETDIWYNRLKVVA